MSKSDFTIVREAEQLLSYIRELPEFDTGLGVVTLETPDTQVGWDWRRQFEKNQVYGLSVPIDRRLEKEAYKWLKSEDWRKRYEAIGVLIHFKSPETSATLKSLLDDPGYRTSPAAQNQGVEGRYYMVRERVYSRLKAWDVDVEKPVTSELIPRYGDLENVNWGRIVEEGELEVLLQSPKLWRLQMWVEELSERDLKTLSKLNGLKELRILGSTLTDADLLYLSELPNLAYLSISGSSISDAGVELLAEFPRLAVLNIRGTQVTEKGRAELMKKLPNLYILPD